ncbi:hypothetical protein PMAYCL1PPCAC_03184, partial [Pristionchus mayeri]
RVPAIGIDLGTTFTAVSYVDKGVVKVIQNNAGNEITPSVVHFAEDIVLVGEEAVKKRRDTSMNTIYNIKRIIGRRHDDSFIQLRRWSFEILRGNNERANIRVDAEIFTPEQISAFILKYMKTIAKKVLFEEPVDAVITVPANFTNAQREATKDAGAMAGLNVLQIVNEPTAAAIAFREESNNNSIPEMRISELRRVLVFDLGGGTFDVSIVEIEGLETRVLATDGLTSLGGSDFDERIYGEALTRFQDIGINITEVDWTLMEACEAAKKALSRRNSARISHVRYGGAGFDLPYSTFIELCEDLFEQTLSLTDKVLEDAALDEELLDEILLVGGSTRIRRIREMLAERFPRTRIRDDIEPELAVAKGAAILAHSLAAKTSAYGSCSSSLGTAENSPEESISSVTLIDVAPLHLGLRLDGDICKVLIPRNARLPFSAYTLCTNVADYKKALTIEILEGDSLQASQNNTLAKVEIECSPKPMNKNLIKVVLSIDVSGILSITAIDVHTEKQVSVTITNVRLRIVILKMFNWYSRCYSAGKAARFRDCSND